MLEFKSCGNHGCRAKRVVGMATNGRCDCPEPIRLQSKANLFWSAHDDPEVRRFAREVYGLLTHIKALEGEQ